MKENKQELKQRLNEWINKIPVNNMGKHAKKVAIESLSKKLNDKI